MVSLSMWYAVLELTIVHEKRVEWRQRLDLIDSVCIKTSNERPGWITLEYSCHTLNVERWTLNLSNFHHAFIQSPMRITWLLITFGNCRFSNLWSGCSTTPDEAARPQCLTAACKCNDPMWWPFVVLWHPRRGGQRHNVAPKCRWRPAVLLESFL